jgi:enoyl-CoA hydratase/carnithine racemase
MESELVVEVDERGVATLTIDRPARRNALTMAMWTAIPRLLADLAADPAVRVLQLIGSGDHFCAGADVDELQEVYGDPAHADAYHAANVAAEDALANFPWPTVAVIRGACVGGGCQLAIACDLRLAETGARFGIPPARLGVVYPAAPTVRLARLVGPARAKYLLYTAELVTADRAEEFGLVDEVVPGSQLADRAAELIGTIASRSTQTQGAVKAAVGAWVNGADVAAAIEPWERRSRTSADVAEGLAAFVERREPNFRP